MATALRELVDGGVNRRATGPLDNALNLALCGGQITPPSGKVRATATLTPTVPALDRPLAEHWSTR